MRFQKYPALCLALLTVSPSPAADTAPADSPNPPPAKVPAPDAEKPLPLADPTPRSAPPPSLLPDEIPAGTKRPPRPAPPETGKPSGTAMKPKATAEELELRIRYRRARNIAETNERVRAAWEGSRGTRTDLEKRQALKRYYELLFAQMIAVDRGVAPLAEKQLKAETATLTQTHIAPTVPVLPDE